MESQAILESCRRLIEEDGCVVAQLGLDGDATTQALCQTELLENPAQRLFGGESILDMGADDRHLIKCNKDHLYNANNANIEVVNKKKVKPMEEPHDCYYLARLPNLIKCQLLQSGLSFDDQRELFSKRVNNICAHYFNDDAGRHQSCLYVGF